MRRASFALTFLFLIFLTCVSPGLAQDNIAEWTYMQYFAMDNNLESALYGDLTEMQAVGSSDQFKIVAQVDRIEGYETRFGNWTDTRRFLLAHEPQPVLTQDDKIEELLMIAYMQPGGDPEALRQELRQLRDSDPTRYLSLLRDAGVDPENTTQIEQLVFNFGIGMTFTTEPVADLGEVNMGTPEALADFMLWAMENYPARHYALTISTHGAGWLGNGPDETDDDDQLQLPEIVQALEQVRAVTGVDQLDIIGFDACLMGQLEVYETLAPYTKYVIAAEEVIPGNGWEYTTPFSQLAADPTMSAEQFGRNIIDAYMAYYAGVGARTKVDLHLIDTSKTGAVVDALSTFASYATQDTVDKLSSLGVARNNAQSFGTDAGDILGTGSSSGYFASVDLISLAELIAGQGENVDADLADAAYALSQAAQAAVVHGGADAYLPDAHGIAVYFPINATIAELPALNIHNLIPYADALPAMGAWSDFLETFHRTIEAELTPDKLNITITQVLPDGGTASIYDPPVAIFDTAGEGIANLFFTAVLKRDDGSEVVLDYAPLVFESILPDGRNVRTFPTGEVSGNSFAWNVETLLVSDGATALSGTLFINNPSITQGVIGGTFVSSQSGEEVTANLVVDTATRVVLSTYGTTAEGAPYEIRTQPGDKFFPTWYTLGSGGLVANRSADFLAYGVNPFTYTYVPAESGNYRLTMVLQDLAGNTSVSSSDLQIDNTGLDPAYRGFKDVERGINFLYPWGWSDPTQLADESGNIDQLSISNPEGDIQIYVAMRDTDIDTAVQNMIDLMVSLPDGQTEAPDVFGDDPSLGQIFGYSYTGEDGTTRYGIVIVVYDEANGASYTFDIDATDARYDEAVAVAQTMVDSLSFFPPLISQ